MEIALFLGVSNDGGATGVDRVGRRRGCAWPSQGARCDVGNLIRLAPGLRYATVLTESGRKSYIHMA